LNQTVLEHLSKISKEHKATLVAVSKTYSPQDVLQVYETGVRDFGENRVQELVTKYEALPKDIHWHLIGHLQSNKVKHIAPFISLIHSVDSPGLASTISQQALKNNRIIDVLLQVHIAAEEHKFGFSEEELRSFLSNLSGNRLPGIHIRGLMGMATFTEDKNQIRSEFRFLKSLFDRIKEEYFQFDTSFNTLSMGMSGDFEIALQEGSNMLRVGSLIFGKRG
jgi:PLP dependent protein